MTDEEFRKAISANGLDKGDDLLGRVVSLYLESLIKPGVVRNADDVPALLTNLESFLTFGREWLRANPPSTFTYADAGIAVVLPDMTTLPFVSADPAAPGPRQHKSVAVTQPAPTRGGARNAGPMDVTTPIT